MLIVGWLPVLVIGFFHYATPPDLHWVHDILRRLYYIPILFAAFSRGKRGGLAVACVVTLTYLPHAFFETPGHHDPATPINKALEVILYNVIGLLAGALADREMARRKEAEKAVAEQKRMADQLIRAGRLAALGELVAGIAHEIKNPLHTLKGTAEIVDEVIPKDSEQASMWIVLRQEIDRLGRVAERFLSFARPKRPNLATRTFKEIYERIGELVRAQVHSAEGTKLHIAPLAPSLEKLAVKADEDQIAQVALNITSNAIKAIDHQGTVRVSGTTRETEAGLQVAILFENDGQTIPDADLERIFDPFFTGTDDGTGLGLAIAERIIEEHGGFIEARNSKDKDGVVFTVLLPAS
jgi:signal transduction histidine kinase